MVTGGYRAEPRGLAAPLATMITPPRRRRHRRITGAVHEAGGKIALQILHAGPLRLPPAGSVGLGDQGADQPVPAARALRARDRAPDRRLRQLRRAGARSRVRRRRDHGLRGLLHQPVPRAPHQQAHRRAGAARRRTARRIAGGDRAPRAGGRRARTSSSSTGCPWPSSSTDGQTWDEVVALAKEVEAAGATIINTGIGWHEARVPTIVTSVPRAAFTEITAKCKPHVGIPVVASNRINMPHVAEEVLARGDADLVSMARPLLADPRVGAQGRSRAERRDQHLHRLQPGLPRPHVRAQDGRAAWSIPRAGRETELVLRPRAVRKHVAVVGAGPGGLVRRGRPGRARSPGGAFRGAAKRSAASSTSPGAFPARRSSPRRSATSAVGWNCPG